MPWSSAILVEYVWCPNKVWQFTFEYCSWSQETSSENHHQPCFGKLACCPIPTLSFCACPPFCWVLVRLL
jgi:hypothetical protein